MPPTQRARVASNDESRAAELRRFLIARRARLKPCDVGLPSVGVRRVPGLRREEVAQLAGVSEAWYTTFEVDAAGRCFSGRFVEQIANALQLDDADYIRLLRLAIPEVDYVARAIERDLAERSDAS